MFNRIKTLLKKLPKQPVDQTTVMNVFRKKYTSFKSLLESNAELLKIISGMEEKLTAQYVFGIMKAAVCF